MSQRFAALATICLAATSGCATTYEAAPNEVGSAVIAGRGGHQAGVARLYSLADEVTISVSLHGLQEGTYAMQLDAIGDCSTEDIVLPGEHLEALPHVRISAEGIGTVSTILRGDSASLLPQIFDGDGTAVVVLADTKTDRNGPADHFGNQLACGVLVSR